MTTYEWDIETVDGDEVLDHDHRDRLSEFGMEELIKAINEDDSLRLCLVRDNDDGRSWAYVIDGQMPAVFLDAYDREVAKDLHRG